MLTKQGVPAASSMGLVEGRVERKPRGSQRRAMLFFYFSIYLQVIFLLLLKVYCKRDVSLPLPLPTPHSSLHDHSSVSGLCRGRKGQMWLHRPRPGDPQAVLVVTMSLLAELLVLRNT